MRIFFNKNTNEQMYTSILTGFLSTTLSVTVASVTLASFSFAVFLGTSNSESDWLLESCDPALAANGVGVDGFDWQDGVESGLFWFGAARSKWNSWLLISLPLSILFEVSNIQGDNSIKFSMEIFTFNHLTPCCLNTNRYRHTLVCYSSIITRNVSIGHGCPR